jgi:hypothetical protein
MAKLKPQKSSQFSTMISIVELKTIFSFFNLTYVHNWIEVDLTLGLVSS